MTHLTHTQQADAHTALAAAIRSGLPTLTTQVSEAGIQVIATPGVAARWRDVHGDELAGFPLQVLAFEPLRAVV